MNGLNDSEGTVLKSLTADFNRVTIDISIVSVCNPIYIKTAR